MSNFVSKKILFSTLFVVILLFLVGIMPRSEKYTQTKKISLTNNNSVLTELDSDNDGLADWEEFLWKTDSKNPDSDMDGTPDGEEVSLKRDPTIKSPNDELEQPAVPEGEEELTTTQKFGRELFTTYAGIVSNPRFKGDKVETLYELIPQSVSGVETPEVYTTQDLNISNKIDNTSLKNYGNALITNFKMAEGLNELSVVTKIIQTGEVKYEQELKNIIEVNKNILEKNLDMQVPKELSIIHLAIINSHSRITDSLEKIVEINNDPLVAIIGIGEYSKTTTEFGGIINDLRKIFEQKNITFSKNEAGYSLNIF